MLEGQKGISLPVYQDILVKGNVFIGTSTILFVAHTQSHVLCFLFLAQRNQNAP